MCRRARLVASHSRWAPPGSLPRPSKSAAKWSKMWENYNFLLNTKKWETWSFSLSPMPCNSPVSWSSTRLDTRVLRKHRIFCRTIQGFWPKKLYSFFSVAKIFGGMRIFQKKKTKNRIFRYLYSFWAILMIQFWTMYLQEYAFPWFVALRFCHPCCRHHARTGAPDHWVPETVAQTENPLCCGTEQSHFSKFNFLK